MKKLLSILGSLTLASSSAIMVASCGTKPQPEDTNEDGDDNKNDEKNTIINLIQDLKDETSKIINDHFKNEDVQNNLIKFSSETDGLGFFNDVENIKKYGTNKTSSYSSTYEEMTKTQWDLIYNDISGLGKITDLIAKINKLGTETGKYDVIKMESIYDSSAKTYLEDSIKIEFTNKGYEGSTTEEEEYIISETEINLKIGIQFKDQESMTQKFDFEVPLIFTYASDQELIVKIKEIRSKILVDYLKADTYSWIDSKDLGYPEENSHKIFDLYKNTERNKELSKFYKGKEFKDEFKKFVKDKYLNEEIFKPLEVEFEENDNEYSTIVANKIQTTQKVNDWNWAGTEAGTYAYFRSYESSDNYEDALDAIMTSLVEEDTAVTFKKYGTKKKNDVIYNLLKSDEGFGLVSQLNKYTTKLDNFLNANKYEGKYQKTNSFMNGTVDIDNLKIKINEDFDLKFSTFSISYAISVDKKESRDDNDSSTIVENTAIGSAVYYNVVKGVQSFQNVFGTRKPSVKNGNGDNAFTTPFAFTGQTNDGTIEGSLWKDQSYFYQAYNTENGVNTTNSRFSLNGSAQLSFRLKLLNDGFQDTFFLGYSNFHPSNNTISKDPSEGLKARYQLDRSVGKGYYLTQQTFDGFEKQYTGLRLQLNFLNVVFVVDPFGGANYKNGVNATFIERASVS